MCKTPFRSTLLFIGGGTVFEDDPHGRKKRPARAGPGRGGDSGIRGRIARGYLCFGRRHADACQTADCLRSWGLRPKGTPRGLCFDAEGLVPTRLFPGALIGAPGGVLRPYGALCGPCVRPCGVCEGLWSASGGHQPVAARPGSEPGFGNEQSHFRGRS